VLGVQVHARFVATLDFLEKQNISAQAMQAKPQIV